MTADIPATVVRLEGDVAWHFPRQRERMAPTMCGMGGGYTGIAIGTYGLDLCEDCVAAVRRSEKKRKSRMRT